MKALNLVPRSSASGALPRLGPSSAAARPLPSVARGLRFCLHVQHSHSQAATSALSNAGRACPASASPRAVTAARVGPRGSSLRLGSPTSSSSTSTSPWPSTKLTLASATTALVAAFFTNPAQLHCDAPESASPAKVESDSTTLLRPASASAPRDGGLTLVFLTRDGAGSKDWQDWVGYFCEAGFDCIDLDVALKGKGVSSLSPDDRVLRLAQELASQLRLSSLPRPPLVFLRLDDADVALAHLEGGKVGDDARRRDAESPRVGGLVVLTPSTNHAVAASAGSAGGAEETPVKARARALEARLVELARHRRVLVLRGEGGADADGRRRTWQDVVRDAERWMMEEGF